MASFLELVLDDGQKLTVEVDAREQHGSETDVVKTSMTPSSIARKVEVSFEQVRASILSISHSFATTLKALPGSVDEAQIEFGLTLDTSADVVLAKIGAQGSFRIVLKWKK